MNFLHENASIGSLVVKKPEYAIFFEKLGIDYCCRGNTTLKHICDEKKLNVSELLQKMKEIPTCSTPLIWDQMSLQEIIEHIVDTYHTYARQAFSRISEALNKLNVKHGERYPHVPELQKTFETMKESLLKHMNEEETIVFPKIIKLFLNEDYNQEELKNDLNSLNEDHLETGEALEKMRKLANDYAPPEDSCITHRVVLNSLEHLEKNLHEHIHKENQILFPRLNNYLSQTIGKK